MFAQVAAFRRNRGGHDSRSRLGFRQGKIGPARIYLQLFRGRLEPCGPRNYMQSRFAIEIARDFELIGTRPESALFFKRARQN